MVSHLLRRLRRRAKRVSPTWRIILYDGADPCQQVEVVRTYRPTRKARAMLHNAFIRFEIEQVA